MALVFLCLAIVHPRADEMEAQLILRDALVLENRPARQMPIVLALKQENGHWDHVLGVARDYNTALHTGHVTRSRATDTGLQLTINLQITADGWTAGGYGHYNVSLQRGSNDELTGSYEGMFNGRKRKGKAHGNILPPRPAIPSLNRVKPAEHPRILVCRSQLDNLRQRAQTPFGKAALKRFETMEDNAIALGLRYALTGESELAQQAIPIIKKRMARGALSDQYGHNLGVRLQETAIAYDFFYDLWPKPFKEKVEAYLFWGGQEMFHHPGVFGGGINWQVASNWATPNYMGLGFAGLALWGEAGPPPLKPNPPHSGESIPAAEDYEPGPGVPVHPFRSGKMPDDWLYAGPFQNKDAKDPLAGIRGLRITFEGEIAPPVNERKAPLADLGGVANARPAAENQTTFDTKTFSFAKLSHEKDQGYWREEIDVTNAAGRRLFSRNYFYTVIRNDASRWVRVALGFGSAKMYLNGVRLEEGDAVKLEPGLYPMMVTAPITWMNSWGRHLMEPALTEVSSEEAE